MKKKKEITGLTIDDLEYEGRGVGRADGKVIFVEDALPGEVVDVRVTRNKRDHAFGIVTAFHTTSDKRVQPFCEHFQDCGGCRWQYLSYDDQLSFKHYFVSQIMRRIGKVDGLELEPILGCERDRFYRNKLEFSFTNNRWLSREEVDSGKDAGDRRGLGLHVRGRFDKIIDINTCHLQEDPSNEIRLAVRDFAREKEMAFYDPVTHSGFLRSLIIRTALTGETMIVPVFAAEDTRLREEMLDFLAERFAPTSISYIINSTANDSVAALDVHEYTGRPYIEEACGHIRLMIHAKSFYQTNSYQAVRLYTLVREWAALSGSELVYDLYCGIGSIGLFLADGCREVVGIDNVEEAIVKARENAEHNNVTNTQFYTGEVETVATDSFFSRHGQPDLVILDPPRAGIHPSVIQTLLQQSPPRIIYVSCKPSTQARDVLALKERYDIVRARPVDMFPQTYHIENVIELRLRA